MLNASQVELPTTVHVPVEERRESSRFAKEPGSDFAVLLVSPRREQLVEVHDESLGGICVVLPNAEQLPIGTEVTLVYHGDMLRGLVRHIGPRQDGQCLVGMQCQRWIE